MTAELLQFPVLNPVNLPPRFEALSSHLDACLPTLQQRPGTFLIPAANRGIARIRRLCRRAEQDTKRAKTDMEMVLEQTDDCIAELTELRRRVSAGVGPGEFLPKPKKSVKRRKGGAP